MIEVVLVVSIGSEVLLVVEFVIELLLFEIKMLVAEVVKGWDH